jgi:phenylacetic acid degradation operon negative regulatory protein
VSPRGPGDDTLQPQDLVITICGVHLRRPDQEVWSGGMVEVLRQFDFSTEASRAALSRLVARGFLARLKEGRRVGYRLTDRAEELLAEGDRRIFAFGRGALSADAWTFVWHAVPEGRRVERARLASQLRFLGFGSLQDATWIARGDREPEVRALLRSLGVEEYAFVLVGRQARGAPAALMHSGAWDFDALARRYDSFNGDYKRLRRGRPLEGAAAFTAHATMLDRFRRFPSLDPELPDELVPLGARRTEAVEIFDVVRERLEEPAARWFAATAELR